MFNLKKIEGGRINVFEPEMLTVSDSADLGIGIACVLSSGKLTAATGSTKPTHITLAAGAKGKTIPCGRIESNQVFETTFSVTPTSLNVGDKVQLATGGKNVTATKESGVATIVDLLGATAADDPVLVRF